MKMAMGVDVIELQSGRVECLKLGTNFQFKLATDMREEKITNPGTRHVTVKTPLPIDQGRDLRRRQHRVAGGQGKVKPHCEIRHAFGACDGIRHSCLADHQAGTGQDAGIVGDFDSLVDSLIEAEIISANDQLPNTRVWRCQCNSVRSRKNWKNSTPSRKRRTIISGLTIISFMIETILPPRK
jgi:hypothetical protein